MECNRTSIVVGDYPRDTILQRLSEKNFQVKRFKSGKSAFRYLSENTVDLVVAVGFALSDMSCTEFLSRVARDHIAPHSHTLYLFHGATGEGASAIWDLKDIELWFPIISSSDEFYIALDQLMSRK